MKDLELTVVCTIQGIEFDKKSGDKTMKYKAVLLHNVENKSVYLGVEMITSKLHESFLDEAKKRALKKLEKSEKDFENVNINDILI